MTSLEAGLLVQRIGFKVPESVYASVKEDLDELTTELMRLYEIEEQHNANNK